MKKHLQITLLVVLSLFIILNSCNKEELPTAPKPVKSLLSKVYSDSTEWVYTYDNDSLLLSRRYNTIKPWDIGGIAVYEYNSNKQLVKSSSYTDDDSYTYVDEFYYDSGLMTKVKRYSFNDSSEDTAWVSVYIYEYLNNELYKIQQYSKNSELVMELQPHYYILEWDDNGNLITEYRYDENDELDSETYYEYDDKKNLNASLPATTYRSIARMKNNLTKIEFVNSMGVNQLYSSSTFQYNEADFPIQEERYYGNEDKTVTYYFEYE